MSYDMLPYRVITDKDAFINVLTDCILNSVHCNVNIFKEGLCYKHDDNTIIIKIKEECVDITVIPRYNYSDTAIEQAIECVKHALEIINKNMRITVHSKLNQQILSSTYTQIDFKENTPTPPSSCVCNIL